MHEIHKEGGGRRGRDIVDIIYTIIHDLHIRGERQRYR